MIYEFGSYELDTRVFELRHAGSVCAIEPQVFDVLAYLAEHRDRVISKEELLEKLWPDRFVSETTLTSRLKAARRAVGDDGKAQSVIRTLHGRGYRFVAGVRISGDSTLVRPTQTAITPALPPGFVGRERELARLDAALERTREGRRQIVFVAGEAGAGKTTLVETFLGRVGQARVARGQCVEHRGSGEPYMPLLDALGRLCRGADAARTIALLERDAPTWLLQMPWVLSDHDVATLAARTTTGDRMLRELAVAIEHLCEDEPLVVLLEDLHWSDFATLEAVDLLARQTHPARLLILGTFRPSDVKASKHPVYAIAHELRARAQCEILDLPLLGIREIDEYLRVRFPGADFTTDLASVLHERTSGNALFVGNLVQSWVERSFLRESERGWVLDAQLDSLLDSLLTGVPDSLQTLIEKQVAQLTDDEQRMLETASVLGREFPVAFLAATLGADDEEVERRCEALARAGRFIASSGTEQWGDGTLTSRFAFTHDLYVDVLYDRIPEARRTRVHLQAGRALERTWSGREREHAAELALHFRRGRDASSALRYVHLAAEQAMQRSAYHEAVLHFTGALELGPDAPAELQIRIRLAPSLVATRGYADHEAEKNYVRACDLARALDDRSALSEILYGLATMYEYRGEYRRAEEVALERIAHDGDAAPLNVVQSHELLACSMLHQGRYDEAVRQGERALETASQHPAAVETHDVVLLVQALGWLANGLMFGGREDAALEEVRKAIALAGERGDELARASALAQAAFCHFYRGEVEECRELIEAAAAIGRERRLPYHVACARILLGWCDAHRGALAESIGEIRAGIQTSLSIGAKMDVPLFLAILADAQRIAGESDAALESLDEAFARIAPKWSFFYLPELYRMSGELLLERGDRDSARAALERARAIAREQRSPLFTARVEQSLAKIGQ